MHCKTCFLTGYPGFLGSQLYSQLQKEYRVHTLGLIGAQTPNHCVADLSHSVPEITDVQYDLVIHAAGKAHIVPKTNEEIDRFFSVNHQGTVNLLRALDTLAQPPKAFVLISTVAVYGRDEGERIAETEPLKASDPYGLSKIKAEDAVMSWGQPETIKGVLRLPLIVGKKPPGNLGRMLKAIQKGRYFNVAGGRAKRSFVWINDIAPFIIRLTTTGGVYNLTDGRDVSFAELYETFCNKMHKRKNPSLPKCMARTLAFAGDVLGRLTQKQMPFDSLTCKKMTSDLTFSCEKAINDFKWQPTNVISQIGNILP